MWHPCSTCAQMAYGGDWGLLLPVCGHKFWTTGMTDFGDCTGRACGNHEQIKEIICLCVMLQIFAWDMKKVWKI